MSSKKKDFDVTDIESITASKPEPIVYKSSMKSIWTMLDEDTYALATLGGVIIARENCGMIFIQGGYISEGKLVR
jgi:hypothetical protein